MTKDSLIIKDWIEQCSRSRRLTKWERDFIDSLEEQFEERGWISDKQEEILERIYADRT